MVPFIADLLRPDAYPKPRPTHISLVTTHISWVFLTDREVWKLKRPVNYGFVDYTTIGRRRHFCEEEVRLNRRLAPDVYLGVMPLRIERGRFCFGWEGQIVDYAVRMRRLPVAASADALLDRGHLTPRHLSRLAERLSRFYDETGHVTVKDFLDGLQAKVTQNFDQTRSFIERFVAPATFDAVHTWQIESLTRAAEQFRTRSVQGQVRDGHGDLRLEHVYFESESSEPLVIDAIEFNDLFRIDDVASDVGFLAMELDARGRHDLAESFLGTFALEANDYDLYAVIDFYLSYRAWVRAKVACFLAADPSTPPEKAARKAAEARMLFDRAASYAGGHAEAGPVIVVGGLMGAGKSTLATALGESLGLPVISSDRTRKHLAGIAASERAPDAAYSPPFSRRTFDEMFRRAGVVLDSGRGVILDATFRDRQLRNRAREQARHHHRPFRFVEAICDETTLRERLRRRSGLRSVSDATEGVLDRLRAEFEPPTEFGAVEHVAVRTTDPLATQVDAVRQTVAATEFAR